MYFWRHGIVRANFATNQTQNHHYNIKDFHLKEGNFQERQEAEQLVTKPHADGAHT